jgi:hypothetical protein
MPSTDIRDKAEEQHNLPQEKTVSLPVAIAVIVITLLAIGFSAVLVFSIVFP